MSWNQRGQQLSNASQQGNQAPTASQTSQAFSYLQQFTQQQQGGRSQQVKFAWLNNFASFWSVENMVFNSKRNFTSLFRFCSGSIWWWLSSILSQTTNYIKFFFGEYKMTATWINNFCEMIFSHVFFLTNVEGIGGLALTLAYLLLITQFYSIYALNLLSIFYLHSLTV